MELAIKGSDQKLSVSDSVFGREFSQDLVHQVVVAFRNAGRSGTKAQLSRSEVRGTTKKFKKQKGGGARHGDYRAPIFIGGGVTFAAKPRSFEQKVNRKMYRGAMCAILSELNRQGRLTVVERFEVDDAEDQAVDRQARDPRAGQASADRHRERLREPVPGRPQHSATWKFVTCRAWIRHRWSVPTTWS